MIVMILSFSSALPQGQSIRDMLATYGSHLAAAISSRDNTNMITLPPTNGTGRLPSPTASPQLTPTSPIQAVQTSPPPPSSSSSASSSNNNLPRFMLQLRSTTSKFSSTTTTTTTTTTSSAADMIITTAPDLMQLLKDRMNKKFQWPYWLTHNTGGVYPDPGDLMKVTSFPQAEPWSSGCWVVLWYTVCPLKSTGDPPTISIATIGI
ncbi:MAG: hypothetical protein M1816_003183 [Peltula sp. TS41687]|nr:MAG: hypothetical protein M1816_003183 [Peltula sp. TS41687]